MPGRDRNVTLISGDTHSWTDGSAVRIAWTYEFLGGHAGLYRAAVKVVISLHDPEDVRSVGLQVLERYQRSGTVAKELTRQLTGSGPVFQTEFDWDSTVNNPAQEVIVTVNTGSSDEPEMILKDPISRRYNFLISFSSDS